MQIITTRSYARQPSKVVGPTVTLIYTNEHTVEEKDESGQTVTAYEYTQYRFDAGEMELVQIGILPTGVEWDDKLRSIEREYLYTEAEKHIAKRRDDVPDQAMLDAWISYKAGVRATPSQSTYPASVTYPPKPE
ncbi:hypothetical protein PED39_05545 [Methanomassiliicoccales archaeon LGM-RCC1]|nr:hypothetical protein PED39_05545 [Methanomassiliicoccales archaeon LGM-RCC1]